MGSSTDRNSTETPPEQKISSAKIAEGLRELVREVLQEELHRPASEPTDRVAVRETQPSWRDAFWMLLFIGTLFSFFSWVPENVLQNPWLEFGIKLIPWFCSYLFFVGYAWFRNQLLAIPRARAFKIFLPVVFVLLLVPRFNIFPVHAQVLPPSAKLYVDGKEKHFKNEGKSSRKLWLSLGRHDIKVSRNGDGKINPRHFVLNRGQLIRAFLGRYEPCWILLYDVEVESETAGVNVEFRHNFQCAFEDNILEDTRFSKMDKSTLLFRMGETNMTATTIPYGDYTVVAQKEGCDPSVEKEIKSQPNDTTIEISLPALNCQQD